MCKHVLYRKLNYRNIKLVDEVNSHGVQVMRRDGTFKVVMWLGFIKREEAMKIPESRSVKLKVSRVDDRDLCENEFVQGCWTPRGVYGVIDSNVAIIAESTD